MSHHHPAIQTTKLFSTFIRHRQNHHHLPIITTTTTNNNHHHLYLSTQTFPQQQSTSTPTTNNTNTTSPRPLRPLSRTGSINSGSTMVDATTGLTGTPVPLPSENITKSLITGNVHGIGSSGATWMKKKLVAREGESAGFTSGTEAAQKLQGEITRRDPFQYDFLESSRDALTCISPLFERKPSTAWQAKKLMEPERVTTFRVPWIDDNNNERINRGYRVQYSSVLGPFRGGLVFNGKLNLDMVRMLGFEQTFRQALSGDGWGGASGGADLDVRGKSPDEIRRFCFSFMKCWLPSRGDDYIEGGSGVGPVQLESLLASYLKEIGDPLADESNLFPHGGAVTKEYLWPSVRRARAAVAFANRALEAKFGYTLQGKRVAISGSTERAFALAEALLRVGAIPTSFSDTTGCLIDIKNGFDEPTIQHLAQHVKGFGSMAQQQRGKLNEYRPTSSSCIFYPITDVTVFQRVKGCEVAFPAISPSEVSADDAADLASSGCKALFEVSDRACTENAIRVLEERDVLFAPSKAVTAVPDPISGCSEEEDLLAIDSAMASLHDQVLLTAMDEILVGKIESNKLLRTGAHILAFLRLGSSQEGKGWS
jgi:glutamate dehydrogenase (NADP+)